jgi:5-methylcytosine-specific restriction endonuclease McrA
MSSYISAKLRREVIERAANCCEYCRIHQNDQFFAFAIDHIIAEKHGGSSTSKNLCLACPDCNTFKGSDIASVDWDDKETIVPLFNPRKDNWNNHFSLNFSGKIEARTGQGRVTIFLLQLNAIDRVQDRKLLIDANLYPRLKDE